MSSIVRTTKIDPLVESYLKIPKLDREIKAIEKTIEATVSKNTKGFILDIYA